MKFSLSNFFGGLAKPKAVGYNSGASTGFGRFFDAADRWSTQGWYSPPRDFQQDAQKWDFDQIVSASRKLYGNCGIAKMVDDKATYAIGRAWAPKYTGSNPAWGKLARKWLIEKYYPISDVRGPNYDFKTNLHIDSVNIDVSGDFGKLFVKTETGWPQCQRVPSHRINSGEYPDNEPMEDGPYKGLKINQGVIYNQFGRPVAYGISTDDGWTTVSARDFRHVFDPSWYDQGRGIPIFTPVLEDMKALKRTQGFEQMAMEILSNIGLVEENPQGHADPTDPANRMRSPATPGNSAVGAAPVVTQSLFGGLIKYFKAGSGSKLSTLQHGRPGPNWESFWDRIIKGACIAAAWPFELMWKPATLGGATLRASLSKANRSCQDRQDVLRPSARMEVQHAIAAAIGIDELEFDEDWYMWDFTMPADLTVDMGREAMQDREDYKHFITSLHDILTPQGKEVADHLYNLADEYDLRQQISAERKVPVEALGKLPPKIAVTETIKD